YTVGQNIVFARGRHAPQTSEGRRLLAHELTHTIQQSQIGASSALTEGSLRLGIPGDAYERDADAITRSVTEGRPEIQRPAFGCAGATVQGQGDGDNDAPPFPPAPAPPVNPIIPPPPGFVPQAWICGRPLRYPGLSMFFGHAYVAAPPDNYAIIAPL